MAGSNLDVLIRNRDGVLFEGECRTVTSFNKVGVFDILGNHANFITLVEHEIRLVTSTGDVQKIAVSDGVCKVKGNKVTIYLGVRQTIEAAATGSVPGQNP